MKKRISSLVKAFAIALVLFLGIIQIEANAKVAIVKTGDVCCMNYEGWCQWYDEQGYVEYECVGAFIVELPDER